MLSETEKKEILESAKSWFKTAIAENHVKNTKKLVDPDEFNVNPFLVKYLAQWFTGTSDVVAIAKILVYPRVLGTSISTSFGQQMQKFVSDVLQGFGSAVEGIDIEFIDQIDQRKKYCQIKLGPTTINKDDVLTIHKHFDGIKNRSRTNNMNLGFENLAVGVLYGEKNQLSAHYKKLNQEYNYPLFIGQEFWERLTGDKGFYLELADAIASVAVEYNSINLLEEVVNELAKTDYIKNLTK